MESEQPQAPQVASSDPFEELVRILSALPTASAMKDISKGRITQTVRQVIETMALEKDDLIKSIIILSKREHIAMGLLKQHYELEKIEALINLDRSTVNISFDAN